ncbi:multicopper oxidase domain-containing protein [Formicincola oecophyllae]|uniref:Multicopper oxidase domain-containing protein n=1 Tax=Formicincola oecophyllae TaxID=2558361 RepID=A0A4Y6UAC3_9PROT|nr:multicopper oxidase family protein [Formicincola oecophyllae]QDH13528.1 multicopper oxidase domain-containing protein [Formicincola oecophyllae]
MIEGRMLETGLQPLAFVSALKNPTPSSVLWRAVAATLVVCGAVLATTPAQGATDTGSHRMSHGQRRASLGASGFKVTGHGRHLLRTGGIKGPYLPDATRYDLTMPYRSPTVLDVTAQKFTLDGKTRVALLINGRMPAPLLRWREGDDVTITVNCHDDMPMPTSIHWHGLQDIPSNQDGTPGLSFAGIKPGESFTYHFKVPQAGTYWYHSQTGAEMARGMYGPIIVDPKGPSPYPKAQRDYVLVLSGWTDVIPRELISNVKMYDDYYDFDQRSFTTIPEEIKTEGGFWNALQSRLLWSRLRMTATDIADVTGEVYSYIINGIAHGSKAGADGWTGIFSKGERVRLHFVNAGGMSLFDVRIPGCAMTLIEADGRPIQPVTVDEFRIAPGETYVVDVTPPEERPYPVFIQPEDRSGYAIGSLTPRATWRAPVPPLDERPTRTLVDLGRLPPGERAPLPPVDDSALAEIDDPGPPPLNADNQYVAPHPTDRTDDPGDGLRHVPERRILNYTMLKARFPAPGQKPPTREIVLHLTGNLERYIWGFNSRKFSDSGPIKLKQGEVVRFKVINDTIMEQPLHLHGLWMQLENGQGPYRPLKHTIIVQPGAVARFVVQADNPGLWALQCQLIYRGLMGMFRAIEVK